ncbi:hypothetical protein NKR23_g7046 [Pleurostoma richardsiae]|uniref:Uncharacterized protein n=1 Tax=Pleurostoma richardsiae TaxID=41990 RepID=A0AA38RBC6_9PEZI|nr:hypothetical protein NKR23_g7046 [Pleurostoma richardsiae]
MDDPNRRRRHNEPARYQAVQAPPQQRRSYTDSRSYRPAPINTGIPPAQSRAMGGTGGYSYYPESSASAYSSTTAMNPGTMGYYQTAADYGQDARQTQTFPQSAHNPASMMYGVQQAGAQGPVYDTNQTFPSRQPAAMGMMADVAASYYEPSNTAGASALQQQAPPSQSPAVYHQSPADRSATLVTTYSTAMTPIGTLTTQTQSPTDASMEGQAYQPSTGLDEAYASYQSALREIFQNIRSGILGTASESLLRVSDWLLSHVSELGLTSDDQNLYNDRIKLWNDFNHAWLAMLQAQKDLMTSRQQLSPSQSLISLDRLRKMGDELVRLCDAVERHGLVDYQYGVWEEQIIDILEECCDLYPEEQAGAVAGPGSGSGR